MKMVMIFEIQLRRKNDKKWLGNSEVKTQRESSAKR